MATADSSRSSQVTLLTDLILLAATVPVPLCLPVHVPPVDADVVDVDFLLAEAVPWIDNPGAAKVTV